MIPPEMLGTLYGLASAASWGTGDFAGGLVSRRIPVPVVVLGNQIVGLALLASLAVGFAEPVPGPTDLAWGGVAGILGTAGLIAFYFALAAGPMTLVAPVTAVVTIVVPLIWGLILEGIPDAFQVAGFALALVAVWLVSRGGDDRRFRMRSLALPFLAGLGFGTFLILIDQLVTTAVLWPLAAARLASSCPLAIFVLLSRPQTTALRTRLPLMALAGAFDAAGNAFYALAAQAGRLDVAAVLSTLYPAATVVLARLILKERTTAYQAVGVTAALIAVMLIATNAR